MLKNIDQTLKESLVPIINGNISKKIVPGVDYISVTGKVIDQNDICKNWPQGVLIEFDKVIKMI